MTRDAGVEQCSPGKYLQSEAREPQAVRLLEAVPVLLADVARETTVSAALTAIADAFVDVLAARSAEVFEADREARTLALAAERSNPPILGQRRLVIPLQDSRPAARAARARTLQFIDALDAEEVSEVRESAPRSSIRAEFARTDVVFAMPLLAGDVLLGALSATFARLLTPDDCAALAALADVLGALVERIVLRGATEQAHNLSREVALLKDRARRREEWTNLVAHELRRPLRVIATHAAHLSRSRPEAPGNPSMNYLLDGVRRMNRLAADLVEVSRLDLQRLAQSRQRTDIAGLACALVDSPVHTSSVRIDVRGDLPEIEVDRERIQQALICLLVNAEDYGRPGGEIRIGIQRLGGELIVSVTSSRSEITDGERIAIFDRYYRAPAPESGGCCVGLYLCRAIVEAHGGRLGVESNPAMTTFHFSLPITAYPSTSR